MQLPESNTALRNLSAIVDFSNNINSSFNLKFVLNNLLLTCFGKVQVTQGFVALFNYDNILKIELSKGISKDICDKFSESNSLEAEETLTNFSEQNNLGLVEKITTENNLLGFLVLGKKFTKNEFTTEDKQFIHTLVKIGSTAIQNTLSFAKITKLNKSLDQKINQLNSIFDLGKEFSSALEIEQVSKLLVYSISAQMLVSKYAIVLESKNNSEILEAKFDKEKLSSLIDKINISEIKEPKIVDDDYKFYDIANKLGIKIIIPMMLNKEPKGLILLGKRMTGSDYLKSDIEFISSVASFAIISIENSRLFKEAIEKQKLEKDLEIAQTIQRNLLPAKLPEGEKFQVAAVNQTARMVGGDFYDVLMLNKNELLLAIADVSGKGIQASLLMANLQAFLKSIYKQNFKLDEASNFLNDLVSENVTNGSFITFFWGILNLEENKFNYVNMGHNPPLRVRAGEITHLKQGGMILGVMKTLIPYEIGSIEVKPNDSIILFTDGITEAMNKEHEEYSDERLESLTKTFKEESAEEVLASILSDVSKHTNNFEQSDDITAMVLKIK